MKLYLNKREKELPIVIKEVVEAIRVINKEILGVSPYRQLVHDISEYFQKHLVKFYELEWQYLFVGTTDISRVGKVGYGYLFFINKGQALDIIFVYGFAKNIIPFELHSSFLLVNEKSWISDTYINNALTSTDCKNNEDYYLFELLKMVTLKIFGNFYRINLDYPKLI